MVVFGSLVFSFPFFHKGGFGFLILPICRSISVIYFAQLCLCHFTYWSSAVIIGGHSFLEHSSLLEHLLVSHTRSWESTNLPLVWAPSGGRAAPETEAELPLACDERLCPGKVCFSSWALGLAREDLLRLEGRVLCHTRREKSMLWNQLPWNWITGVVFF